MWKQNDGCDGYEGGDGDYTNIDFLISATVSRVEWFGILDCDRKKTSFVVSINGNQNLVFYLFQNPSLPTNNLPPVIHN